MASTTSTPQTKETALAQWHVWMINGALVTLCICILIVTFIIVIRKKHVLKRRTCKTCMTNEETVCSSEPGTHTGSISPPSYEEAMRSSNGSLQTLERGDVVLFRNTDNAMQLSSSVAITTSRF